MKVLTSWFVKYRFAIVCLSVFGIMCLHTISQQWVYDFWEHSAVIRELATHILHPKHPQLLLDAPHAFYSPYAVMVAYLARTFQLDAVKALSIMGLVNLCLFFLGLRLFVFSVVSKHRRATAFYTLLLTLFFWGSHPWNWSGFFHIGSLGKVIPYPSTFAVALTMIALGVNQLRIKAKRQIWFIPMLMIAVTVLITHPTTFLFLLAGFISQSCTEKESLPSQIIVFGVFLCLTFLIASFWPYFSILKLLISQSVAYHDDCRCMYDHVVSRIWPSLIGVPLVIYSMRSNWRRPLVLMLVILSGIYVFGEISGKYAYGRVISFIVLLLHVTIAEHLSMLESKMHESHSSRCLQRHIVLVSVMVLSLFLLWKPLKNTLMHALFEPPIYKPYLFLSQFTRQYDVVLSDLQSSWIVPTFGGKVIATIHPLAFVPDHYVRRLDLYRFFDGKTSQEERQQIIHKYKANYLLLRKSEDVIWRDLQQSFMSEGQVVFESDNFVLIWLKTNHRENVHPQ